MKLYLYIGLLLCLFVSCSETDQVDYSQLSVSFLKTKIDVGESSGILDIPVILSGCEDKEPLSVKVACSATAQTALEGVDYELLTPTVTFSTCGTATVQIRLINNDVITEEIKTFSLRLTVETPEVQLRTPEAQIYIINDDAKKYAIPGHYTLTAENYTDGTKYSSAVGGVEIVQDVEFPERYYMRQMVLQNGENVLPLSQADDLYFTVDVNGKMSMPIKQNIGNYGKGNGSTVAITADGYTSNDPIGIQISYGRRLVFGPNALAGIYVNSANQLTIYYALKNIVLEKVIE